MKKIILMVLLIAITKVVQAQSLEILDSNPYIENVIKKKFMSFQQSTVKNTCIGVDRIEEKNIDSIFKNKPRYQLMYWRYSGLNFEDSIQKTPNSRIVFNDTKNDYSNSTNIFLTIGVIKNIID